jgi:hypothetical protein
MVSMPRLSERGKGRLPIQLCAELVVWTLGATTDTARPRRATGTPAIEHAEARITTIENAQVDGKW